MIEFLSQPWAWYVAGPLIALVLFLMLYYGESFGVSSTTRQMCAAFGADRFSDFFKFDWKAQSWNLVFVLGTLIGGAIAAFLIPNPEPVQIATSTYEELSALGMQNIGSEIIPTEIFSWAGLLTLRGFVFIVLGGFLVGFGARYAGGCTSGHAISGLSNLQWPSLVAVIGFFIGGMFLTFFLLPILLNL